MTCTSSTPSPPSCPPPAPPSSPRAPRSARSRRTARPSRRRRATASPRATTSRSRRRTCGTRTAAPAAAWASPSSTPASPATCPDFRVSDTDKRSRVIGSARRQPGRHHGDRHVRPRHARRGHHRRRLRAAATSGDPKKGRYMGVAPDANLVSIKVSDDEGNATVLDVIAGIQFAVDHKDEYNIRVLNLSLESTVAESYKTDPLDAAVEAAWFKGIFVVAAAGNRGPGGDAVHYAPGNDPYIVTVGAVDDNGTKDISDDEPTSWSSRGTTQDGFAKPDIYAPGAQIVSNLAPESKYTDALRRVRQRRRRVHPRRRHLDGRPDGGGRRRDRLPARPDADPEPRQGAAARLRPRADGLDRRAQPGRRRPPLLRRRWSSRQPGPRRRTTTSTPPPARSTTRARAGAARAGARRRELLRSRWSRSSWSHGAGRGRQRRRRSTWRARGWSRSSWSTSWTK